MVTAVIILLYIGIILFELKQYIKAGEKKIIWVYSIILIITFVVLFLKSLDVYVPGPSDIIKQTIRTVFKMK